MGYPLRYVPPGGAVVEITNRTIQGRYLLRPGEAFHAVFLGILGRAQRRTGVQIHFYAVLSNHLHLLVYVETAKQLADFCGYLFGNLAREVCKLYGWSETVWPKRYTSVVVTEEELAQLERLRYSISNSCKEGLVSSPLEWPGPHAASVLAEGATASSGEWINRTQWYRARKAGKTVDPKSFHETETVHLTPLPCWADLSRAVYAERVRALIEAVEEETRQRHAEQGTEPLGVEGVLEQPPHARAKVLTRTRAPLVHAATEAMRWAYWQAYHQFVMSYRAACARLRETGLPVAFPEGAFLPPGLTAASG